MKQFFLRQGHAPRLTLFFTGWGMDDTPFHPCSNATAESDLLLCYDYRQLDNFDEDALRPYTDITLVAWSMGVWAASQVLQKSLLPLTERIAVNGTITPVDEERGIPFAVFNGTLAGLTDASLRKFQRRMCTSASTFQRFLAVAPRRPLEELRHELDAIGQQCLALPPADTFRWDKAVISTDDRIFCPANQLRAWTGKAEIHLIEGGGHYEPDQLPPYNELALSKSSR